MMKLQTLSAGSANLSVEGVDFLIERNHRGIWEAYMDGQGKPLVQATTRKMCAEVVLEIIGISAEVTSGGRPPAPKAAKNARVLENWSFTKRTDCVYSAPETGVLVLQGEVDGRGLQTSQVIKITGRDAHTQSGSVYTLGAIDPNFAAFMAEKYPTWNPEKPTLLDSKSRAKAEKPSDSNTITVYSHRQGLTVYGADEVCAKFAQVSGKVTQVPGKNGKPGGYRLPADMRKALWARMQNECQGRTLKVVKGRTKTTHTL